MKASDFLKWSTAAAATKTKLPQVVSLIPLLGYAVLYGDQFQDLVMRFTVLGPDMWLTPMQRIALLYAGGIFVLIGLAVFYAACPSIIRQHGNAAIYIRYVFDTGNDMELRRAHKGLSELLEKQPLKHQNDDYFNEYPARMVQSTVSRISGEGQRQGILFGGQSREAIYAGLGAYFTVVNRSRRGACLACLTFMGIGALLFLLPSLEVFLMVINHLGLIPATT